MDFLSVDFLSVDFLDHRIHVCLMYEIDRVF